MESNIAQIKNGCGWRITLYKCHPPHMDECIPRSLLGTISIFEQCRLTTVKIWLSIKCKTAAIYEPLVPEWQTNLHFQMIACIKNVTTTKQTTKGLSLTFPKTAHGYWLTNSVSILYWNYHGIRTKHWRLERYFFSSCAHKIRKCLLFRSIFLYIFCLKVCVTRIFCAFWRSLWLQV